MNIYVVIFYILKKTFHNIMTKPSNFRYGRLSPPTSPADVITLTDNFKTNFFDNPNYPPSYPPSSGAKVTNFGVNISKKMWLKLTKEIFFNETDFQQNDGVTINFGYDNTGDDPTNNLILLLNAFKTTNNTHGEDVVLDEHKNTKVLINHETISEVYSTKTDTSGSIFFSIEGGIHVETAMFIQSNTSGGGGTSQRPPPKI